MRWKALLWTVAVLVTWTGALSTSKKKETNTNQDLFILSDTQVDGSTDVGSGSGSTTDQENSASGMGPDDEDASNGGSGERPQPTVEASTPSRQLTPCQQLRITSPNFKNTFVAQCTDDGEFQRKQCRGDDRCWCADPQGGHIKGTTKIGDMRNVLEQPDCHGGSNLSPCTTLLVQYKWDGYHTREPNCSADGAFLPMQCQDNECWCVNFLGKVIDGTGKISPEYPSCGSGVERVTGVSKGLATHKLPTPDTDISLEEFTHKPDGGLYVVPGNGQGTIEMDPDNLDTNQHSDRRLQERQPNRSPVPLIQQPGMLAGIIGGAVVGLLCAVLLIMFIVYRIRKKDEGSYALDEPTKARGAYAYQKAPDKEFYA